MRKHFRKGVKTVKGSTEYIKIYNQKQSNAEYLLE